MKKKLLGIGVVACLAVSAIISSPANAYVLIGKVWTSTASAKVPYALEGNVSSSQSSKISTSNKKWNSLTNSTLKTGDLLVTRSASTMMNVDFTVAFQDLKTSYGVDVPGLTQGASPGSNSAHVRFNSTWTWSTTFDQSIKKADLETVAVHEFGHAYGLDHMDKKSGPYSQAQINSVMNVTYTVKRTPNSDDIAGTAYLY